MTEAQQATAPVEVIVERLNDPAVASSLITLLDNAELLSTLVLGLSGLIERSDSIMDTVVEGIDELRQVRANTELPDLPSPKQLANLAGKVTAATPLVEQLLDSPAASPATIDFLGRLSAAATEGVEQAKQNDTRLGGLLAMRRAIRDPEVQRGMGLMIEIAKALGRQTR